MTQAPGRNRIASRRSRPQAASSSRSARSSSIRGTSACVSGSPKRTLNSSTFAPSGVCIRPAYRQPVKWRPRRASSRSTGTCTTSQISAAPTAPTPGTGEYAPMPPVFGPVSPSPIRLKSCAAASGTAVSPSQIASSDTSGPVSRSSITSARPASPSDPPTSIAAAAASAWAASSQTTTPLPAARPSALITAGPPSAARAARASVMVVAVKSAAVGTPAACMTSFANAFEPSRLAAAPPGPNTGKPAGRSASASPATSGASGPTTTRSASTARASSTMPSMSVTCTGWHAASAEMPGLPGAACSSVTDGERASAAASACSRPPDADDAGPSRDSDAVGARGSGRAAARPQPAPPAARSAPRPSAT